MSTSYFLITLAIFSWLSYLTFLIYRKYKNNSSSSSSNIATPDSATINRQLNKLNEVVTHSISKVGLVRYNPFDEVGGDQSFILTLLDNHNTGVIITSLHNRGSTRIYAKNIKNGENEFSALSKEEKTAILKTISS